MLCCCYSSSTATDPAEWEKMGGGGRQVGPTHHYEESANTIIYMSAYTSAAGMSCSHTYSVIYLREIKNCNGRYGSK
jgi:hypothetical protein